MSCQTDKWITVYSPNGEVHRRFKGHCVHPTKDAPTQIRDAAGKVLAVIPTNWAIMPIEEEDIVEC